MKAGRYWRTLRHLKTRQLVGQLRSRIIRRIEQPARVLSWQCPPLELRPLPKVAPKLTPPVPLQGRAALLSGHFEFLNHGVDIGFPPKWNSSSASRLWNYNLHYFDWLWTLADGDPSSWKAACLAVDDWMGNHPPTRGSVGWEPYPTSLRLFNWTLLFFGFWRSRIENEDPAFRSRLWESIWRQGEWLSRHLETHLLANHLLENAAALALLGSVFAGDSAASWRAKGIRLLREQVAEQILGDGVHFERSPMYHLRVLWLLQSLVGRGDQEIDEIVQHVLPKMRSALGLLRHPDGRIALLNDAAHGIYAEDSLGVISPACGPFALPDAGYYGWRSNMGDYLVADVGAVGPDYQPGHAHADQLSFELSLGGRRVVSDTGVHDYELSASRAYVRSTAAHNTVELDGLNSCEVWGAFRVGRRTVPKVLRWEPSETGIVLEAEHDGYRHLRSGPTHRRRFSWQNRGLEIADWINARMPVTAIGRLHLAPECDVRLQSGAVLGRVNDVRFEISVSGPGRLELSSSLYHPEFGVSIQRPCLAYVVNVQQTAHWTTTVRVLEPERCS